MKTLKLLFICFCINLSFSQVGIGTTDPDASSMLDIESTTSGLLIPRMTQAQRLAIGSPVEGLMVYQTNLESGFWYYKGGTWTYLSKEGDDDWHGPGRNDINGDLYKYGKVDIRASEGLAAITVGSDTTEPVGDGIIAIGPHTAITSSSKFVIGKERIPTAYDSTYTCSGVSGCSWQVYASEFLNRNAFEVSAMGEVTINSQYTLPVNDGNSGDILTTDGNGNLSWQASTLPRAFSASDTIMDDETLQLKTLKRLQAELSAIKKKIKTLETEIVQKYYRKEESD
ncbi:hypothetical protein [Winogradskyella ouciana]|uniref:hypothetical protein n=1 Tax=Winogradskyella ouciana TaxID=2608631 RepID=UPI003D29CFFE